MGMFEWMMVLVIAIVCVIGIMFMAASNANTPVYTDTFGNTYENQTNATMQAARGVAEGSGSAASGLILVMAIVVLVGAPIGFALFKRPRW